MGGLQPVIEFMTFNFAMQAIDHIINSAAKTNYMSGGQMRCPIVFRGPNGAAARVGAQHSQNYGPWYASVPGLVVIAPYRRADAKGLLKAAIRSDDPVVFLENELLYGQSFDVPQLDDYVLPIGKARIVREGSDVTLVSYSIGVGVALEAAKTLAGEGIEAEVIDLRTLRPLDKATVLASLAKTNRMVVVEEGWPTCSIASEIIAIAHDRGLRRPRRAGAARDQRGRAAALCRQPRETGADQGRGRRHRRESRLLSLTGRSTAIARSRCRACRRGFNRHLPLCGRSIWRWPMSSPAAPSRRWARSASPGGARRCNGSTKAAPPAEPRLQAVADHLLPRGDQRAPNWPSSRMAGWRCSNRFHGLS